MNPVRIHEGQGHSRQNYFCDTVQCMDSLQLLILYLTRTPIFLGRKAKVNLHTTPKLTVVMPISCLLPCADPEIVVKVGGGGGLRQSDKKALTFFFFFFFFFFFLLFFLVLSLFYRSQMDNFNDKYHCSRFRRGSKLFQRGGGGVSNFFQGVQCLFPIETLITCDFPEGGPDPLSPLWIRNWLRSI